MKRLCRSIGVVLSATILLSVGPAIGCKESGQATHAVAQKNCVFDKNPIDQRYSIDAGAGRMIYFCSEACLRKAETQGVPGILAARRRAGR